MKNRFKIWIISVVIMAVGISLGMFIYVKIQQHLAKELYLRVRNNPKVYVYETYYTTLTAVMYVDKLEDTSALIDYYKKTAKHDTSAVINFEIKDMPLTMYEPIYVYSYLNKSSNIVRVIDFDVNCWGYISGYVYKPTTHMNAPPDSSIKRLEALDNARGYDKRPNHQQGISPYGWWCNH